VSLCVFRAAGRLFQVVFYGGFRHTLQAGFEIESIETKCDIDLVDGTILTSFNGSGKSHWNN
jgi:hypothetical protein